MMVAVKIWGYEQGKGCAEAKYYLGQPIWLWPLFLNTPQQLYAPATKQALQTHLIQN